MGYANIFYMYGIQFLLFPKYNRNISILLQDKLGGVMVVFPLSAVDRGFEPRSGQRKDYEIDGFSALHAALRRKSKDWLAQNQVNVSEWDMLFQ